MHSAALAGQSADDSPAAHSSTRNWLGRIPSASTSPLAPCAPPAAPARSSVAQPTCTAWGVMAKVGRSAAPTAAGCSAPGSAQVSASTAAACARSAAVRRRWRKSMHTKCRTARSSAAASPAGLRAGIRQAGGGGHELRAAAGLARCKITTLRTGRSVYPNCYPKLEPRFPGQDSIPDRNCKCQHHGMMEAEVAPAAQATPTAEPSGDQPAAEAPDSKRARTDESQAGESIEFKVLRLRTSDTARKQAFLGDWRVACTAVEPRPSVRAAGRPDATRAPPRLELATQSSLYADPALGLCRSSLGSRARQWSGRWTPLCWT